MSFITECIEDSLPIWQQCYETDFLRQMRDGSLSEDCFAGYMLDDSLYLREYAKVFACGILKSRTQAEIRAYYSFLSFVNEGEGSTRIRYLKKIGLTDADVDQFTPRSANKAYTDFMIWATQKGTTGAECMMAGLPCMISYAWLFHKMVEDDPTILQGPYGELIQDYVAPSSDAICVEWVDFANQLCTNLTPQQKQDCMAIFRQSSLYELKFWQMSQQPRTDLAL